MMKNWESKHWTAIHCYQENPRNMTIVYGMKYW